MKHSLFSSVTAAVALISFGQAPSARADRPQRLIKRLIRVGALDPAEIGPLRAARAEARACRKAVVAGAAPRGACRPKGLAVMTTHRALLERTLPKISRPRLRNRVLRAIDKLSRRIGRASSKLGAAPPPPGSSQPAAPPPLQ